MSWRLAMELYEAKLVGTQRGGGTWLSARQMSSARAWCKRLSLGKQGLSWQWEEPLAMGEQGSTRGKPCWVLARGLYQAQSAGANDAGVYQVFVAVGGEGKESKFFMEFEEAWGYALGVGLVEVPPEEELWGRVRSLCAQQQWQQVEEQVLRFVAAADVRSRLSRYRSEVRRQWYNALERELGLAQLQGEGPEAEVEQAQEHRAAYAKLYARVKQAQARVEELDAGQLQKSAHKAYKKHMKQLEEKLEKERRWRWWSTGMGLWALWAMEEQAQQLEELAAALEAGQPVVKKQRRRVEADEASVRLVQDRQSPELHERLRARRKETGQLQGALEAQLGIQKGRLGEWERGVRGVTHAELCAWAQALGWSVELEERCGARGVWTAASSSSALVEQYNSYRLAQGISQEAAAPRVGWVEHGLALLQDDVSRGSELTAVQAQLWAYALGLRYVCGGKVAG